MTSVFSRAWTQQNADGASDHKYVIYNFEEANRYTLGIGVGAQVGRFGTPSSNSLASPGGSTGFSPLVSLDVSRLNFLGVGHTVGFHGLYSNLEKRGSMTYQVPRFLGVQDRTAVFTALYDNTLNVLTFASKRQEASVQVLQKFSKALTGQLRFSYRRVSVTNVVIPALLVPQLAQPVRIGILTANLSQDRRDDPADTHRGVYNTLDIGMAGSVFGSQRSFGRALVRNAFSAAAPTRCARPPTIRRARATRERLLCPAGRPRSPRASRSAATHSCTTMSSFASR